MKVSTRIIGGFGILLLVAIAALAYQVSVIHRMQSINRTLSQVNFEAAASVQTMEQQILDLEADCRKYFVLNGDPTYGRALADLRNEFSVDLGSLETNARTPRERNALKELSSAWATFWRAFDDERSRLNPDSIAEAGDLPFSLRNALNDLS